MTYRLILRRPPPLRLDMRALQPARAAALTAAELGRLELPHGCGTLALAEVFDIAPTGGGALVVEGELERLDFLGAGMEEGTLEVHGTVGDALGLGLRGGAIRLDGSARDLAGCAMSGGSIEVSGDVRDLAASALPGDLDGVRGGSFVIRGNAGARLGDRMRRGTLVVHGDVGEFAASRLVAGTIALGGRCGPHLGYGMRRGTIVFAGAAPAPGPTFVPLDSDIGVFWQLLARELEGLGGAFAGLVRRRVERLAGDLSVQGRGELLLPT